MKELRAWVCPDLRQIKVWVLSQPNAVHHVTVYIYGL